MNSPPSRHSLKTRITLATLGVFLASLWTLSLFSTRGLQRDIEKLVSADQLVTAGLIAEQLDHELKERLQSLQALAGALTPQLGESEQLQRFLDQRPDLLTIFDSRIFITDRAGDTLATLRKAVPTTPDLVIVRADSAYFRHDVTAAATAGGARFSVTARLNKAVVKAIASIDEQAWTTIRYRDAVYDEVEHRWISQAEVAEVPFTAFTSHRQADHVTARLIVRRVTRLNPHTAKTQGELLPGYRYHPIFTNSTLPLVDAEAAHRDHAIIEAVIADLKDGPLAHAPSGRFTANAAWLALAAIAFNLTRAAARLASETLGKARTATVRRTLIQVAGRIANQARRWRLHLPTRWPWQDELDTLYTAAQDPPALTAS